MEDDKTPVAGGDVTPGGVGTALAAPFRTGLVAGLGLAVAYGIYLSAATLVSTFVVLAISLVLTAGLSPVVTALTRRGFRRGVAVAITYLAFLAVLAAALYAIVPPVLQQISLLVGRLPDLLGRFLYNPTVRSLNDSFEISERLQSATMELGELAASSVFAVAGVAIDLVVVLVLTLYLLGGLPTILSTGYRLVPASRRRRVRYVTEKVVSQLGGYLVGAALTALQAGVIACLFAYVAGLPYPFAIGAGAALLDLVPIAGPVVAGISISLIGFMQSTTLGVVSGLFYLVQHLFESYWLHPRIMRRTVHIHPGVVIVAVVAGAAIMGICGALLAVPAAVVVQLVVSEVLIPRQDRH